MKKTLLLTLLLIPFAMLAQTKAGLNIVESSQTHVEKFDRQKVQAIDLKDPIGPAIPRSDYHNKTQNYDFINIGQTYYDLQTNSSPGRRVLLHADGTISAVWTTSSATSSTWPDRGAGYNYYDGSNWLGIQTNRVESSTRTGWPSIMVLGNGSEAIYAHESNTGGFVRSTNGGKGSTTWTTDAAVLDDVSEPNTNRVPIWNRSASSGDYVHLISNYWFSEDAGVPLVTRNGVASPTTYSRSSDNGATWDTVHMLLPGYDSTLYLGGGGDNYAIDVKDSIVAILTGGILDPVSLWKSTDNGETFTYIDVDSLPYKGEGIGIDMFLADDTMFNINDGSLDVMIDGEGDVHAFWGSTFGFGNVDPATGDTGAFYNLTTARIMHWQEGDAAPKACGGAIDMDGDQMYTVEPATFAALQNDQVPVTQDNLLSASRYGGLTLIHMPSASYDADGNIYVTYSAPVETDVSELGSNFRDIYVSYSTDGGDTWNGPQNVTQQRGQECTFPCVAKFADDNLHLIFQQDNRPGTNLQNHDASFDTHPNDISDIMYVAIPTSEIIANNIGQNTLSTEKDLPDAIMVVSQNQPNPFSSSSEVIVYLRNASNTTLTVTDMLGNVINQGSLGLLNAGNHSITIDAEGLATGMYLYTIEAGDSRVTRKMQVK